ncbi:hypothetical protein FQN57_005807 [Myotisia sp. PD_48]|nr:hypothetical protein FQN57_005807 [Myotisia sp. PD_48]
MSGAEFVAVLGVVASAIQIVAACDRLSQRLEEYRLNIPLQDVTAQLPLLSSAIGVLTKLSKSPSDSSSSLSVSTNSSTVKLHNHEHEDIDPAETFLFDSTAEESLKRVLEGCRRQLDKLEQIITELTPDQNASVFKKRMKALRSLGKDKKIRDILGLLDQYKSTITLHLATRRIEVEAKPGHTERDKTKIFDLPARKVTHFIGREELLRRISLIVTSHQHVSPNEPAIIVLTGLGGQGKTQLALKFCHSSAVCYDAVFWLDASSETTVKRGYENIANLLSTNWSKVKDIPDKKRYVFRKLTSLDYRWLIVFDNYDSPQAFKNITSYFPSQWESTDSKRNNLIIVTSRLTEAARLGIQVEVEALTEDESLQLLNRRISPASTTTASQNEDGKRIVRMLGYLALAIDQAAAYILMRGLSLHEFINHYENRKAHILSFTPTVSWEYQTSDSQDSWISDYQGLTTHHLSVLTTWELSISQLPNPNKDAILRFLTLAAFFNPTRISEELFSGALDYPYSFIDDHDRSWPRLFSTDGRWDTFKYQDTIASPSNISLIQRPEITSNGTVFSLHPLIKEWLQLRESPASRVKCNTTAARLIFYWIKGKHAGQFTFGSCQEGISHIDTCLHYDKLHPNHEMAYDLAQERFQTSFAILCRRGGISVSMFYLYSGMLALWTELQSVPDCQGKGHYGALATEVNWEPSHAHPDDLSDPIFLYRKHALIYLDGADKAMVLYIRRNIALLSKILGKFLETEALYLSVIEDSKQTRLQNGNKANASHHRRLEAEAWRGNTGKLLENEQQTHNIITGAKATEDSDQCNRISLVSDADPMHYPADARWDAVFERPLACLDSKNEPDAPPNPLPSGNHRLSEIILPYPATMLNMTEGFHEQITGTLRKYQIQARTIDVARSKSERRIPSITHRPHTTLIVTAEKEKFDDQWLHASTEIFNIFSQFNLHEAKVEIRAVHASKTPFYSPVPQTDPIYQVWPHICTQIIEYIGRQGWHALECLRAHHPTGVDDDSTTVILTVPYEIDRDWKQLREKIISILDNYSLWHIAVRIECGEVWRQYDPSAITLPSNGWETEAQCGMSLGPLNSDISSFTFACFMEGQRPNGTWAKFGLTCFIALTRKIPPLRRRNHWRIYGFHPHENRDPPKLQQPSLKDHKASLEMLTHGIEKRKSDPFNRSIKEDLRAGKEVIPPLLIQYNKDLRKVQEDETTKRKEKTFEKTGKIIWALKPSTPEASQLDWALIQVDPSRVARNKIPPIGSVAKHKVAFENELLLPFYRPLRDHQKLCKVGRTTGYTVGEFSGLKPALLPSGFYDDNGSSIMEETFEHLITPMKGDSGFSKPGDTGAAVFDERCQFVGLLFAGCTSTGGSYFIPVDRLFEDIKRYLRATAVRMVPP